MATAVYWRVECGGVVVASRCRTAFHMGARIRGLLGRASLEEDEALWIRPCNSIHMFFMRFPIDAVFLDRDERVVRIFHSIQPWRCAPIVRGAYSCLEIAAGRALETGLREGEQLVFQPVEPGA